MEKTKTGRKSLRTTLFTVLTAVIIVVVLGFNLISNYFGIQKGLYVDLTPEGLYSLTDAMVKECSFVDDLDDGDKQIEIIFCADPDTLIGTQLLRPTYFMALQLQERFDNLEVKTVNPEYDPTAISAFKPTSLSKIEIGDIIISYGGRYRIQKPVSFWAGGEETLTHYNGEYTMASCLMSVTAMNRPVAYFVTNHGETYYDPDNPAREENHYAQAIYDLITGRGLEVKTLDLLAAGGVPEDCMLLVINNPRSDFSVDPDKLSDLSYISETEMIDRYLVNNQGSLIVARDHALDENGKSRHPNLDTLLCDWGFKFTDTVVEDPDNHLGNSQTTIYGEYSTDEDSFGALVYSDFASLPTAAKVVFSDAGYITTSFDRGDAFYEAGDNSERLFMSFMDSFDSAVAKSKDKDNPEYGYNYTDNKGNMTLAAMTGRYHLDSYTNVAKRSNVFCVNSASFFSNEILGNYSYANHEVMSLLLEEMLFNDQYASNELGGSSANFENYGGKQLADISLNITSKAQLEVNAFPVLLFAIPVGALVCGIVVYTKRKYL